MVYFYSRVEPLPIQMVVSQPRTRKEPREENAQVAVMIPSRDHEAGEGDEEVLCDPCFLGAIHMALSPINDFKAQVLMLPCMNQPKMVTTRASGRARVV